MVKTRAALRDALLALIEQKSFDQITVRDIATKSGTGYATFFRHYRDKTELLQDIAADEIRALIGLSLPALETQDARAAARALCQYVDGRRKLWAALLTGGAAGIMREEFIRESRRIALERPSKGEWFPDDLKVMFGVCTTVEILSWWLQRRDTISREQLALILDRLVITPTMTADDTEMMRSRDR